MEGFQSKVENAIRDMVTKLDEKILRKMQRDTYQCCANCFDDKTLTMESVQRCTDMCSAPLKNSQDLLDREMQSFQDRLYRCSLDCQDSIKDKSGAEFGRDPKHRMEFESCVLKCGDKLIAMLPNMSKNIESHLKEQHKHINHV